MRRAWRRWHATLPRKIALDRIAGGEVLHCVWSGKRLTDKNLDIDHCVPWSIWPCSDLWNLVPADRRVNQHAKGDRLPSADALRTAAEAMRAWWRTAYTESVNPLLASRFANEARASLPGLADAGHSCDADEVYTALGLQRVRLHQDQGVPEWPRRLSQHPGAR
jgi:hypothetical protein